MSELTQEVRVAFAAYTGEGKRLIDALIENAEKAEARIAKLEAEIKVWRLNRADLLSDIAEFEADNARLTADLSVKDGALKLVSHTVHTMQEYGSWHKDTMDRVVENCDSLIRQALAPHPGDKLLAELTELRKRRARNFTEKPVSEIYDGIKSRAAYRIGWENALAALPSAIPDSGEGG